MNVKETQNVHHLHVRLVSGILQDKFWTSFIEFIPVEVTTLYNHFLKYHT